MNNSIIYSGGCHCQSVRFNVAAAPELEVDECNCSICRMSGFLHLIVPARDFTLLKGHDMLTEYTFNTGVAKHYFCSQCGIKPFYIPRSNPDGIDVNVRCLDNQPESMTVIPFDGQNWEANAASLLHKSQHSR